MEHKLSCTKTFRYFTHGNPQIATKLLYVLHGYGQLASYFIQKFQDLGDDFFIVAPEGMHRFYLEGTSGRVGASWMTKESRETDIHDTMNWLNELELSLASDYEFEKKIILGFSQGGATAARWHQLGNQKANHVIYWASVFPPDLPMETETIGEETKSHHFVIGKNDRYFQNEQQYQIVDFYTKKNYLVHQFDGGHAIDEEILKSILNDC